MMFLQGETWTEWFHWQYELVFNAIHTSLRSLAAGFAARLPYIVAGLIVFFLFWLLARIFRWLFLKGTGETKINSQLRTLISRLIVVIMIVVGTFTSLSVMIESFDFGQVVAGLGFTSFVVGFATKDILNNFLSGILILWQRPFNLGDYLFVGANQGRVEHIGVRATMLRKDDGENVLIPNGEMYSSALTIRGAGKKRRMKLQFNVPFDTDFSTAKATILDTIGSIEGVVTDPPPSVYVTDYEGSGAVTSVQFWIDTNEDKPLRVFDRAAIAILKELRAKGIGINGNNVSQPGIEAKTASQPGTKEDPTV